MAAHTTCFIIGTTAGVIMLLGVLARRARWHFRIAGSKDATANQCWRGMAGAFSMERKKAAKPVLLAMMLLLCGTAFANDTYFFISGGNLVPATEGGTSVQMAAEVITLTLEPRWYEVTVDFTFYNPGDAVRLSVGFPFFTAGVGGHGKIYDFACWTDGAKTDWADMPIVRQFSNDNYGAAELENAYVREITFAARQTTTTRVSYKSEYGSDTTGAICKYLYGSGSSWKGAIGKMTLIVQNDLPYDRPDQLLLAQNDAMESFTRMADNRWQAEFYDVEPEYADCITVHVRDILDDTGPRGFPAYFPYAKRRADATMLFWYTKPQLRIVRNAIYALHGYDFRSADLRAFFAGRGRYWNPAYAPNPQFSEADLSDAERYNVRLILAEESRR